MDKPFYLKQFALHQGNTAQRVGTDALLLGAWPFVHTLPEKAHILDVGAGTGIVSLMMAQRFSGAMVDAWEVEDGALKDAATNFAASPFADRLRIHSQDYLYAKREQWHPFDLIISNPPYGERLSDDAGVTKLYAEMGQVFAPLKTWSKFILTSDEAFESKYGSLADKKRKLYNGTLKVDLYQYFGQRVKRQEVK